MVSKILRYRRINIKLHENLVQHPSNNKSINLTYFSLFMFLKRQTDQSVAIRGKSCFLVDVFLPTTYISNMGD